MNKLKQKLDVSMKDTKLLTGRNEGAAKRLEKELWSANAEKDRYEQVLERV